MVQLEGGTAQPSATARILTDQQSHQWLLLATGMTPQPPDKTYELWFITADQKAIPGGTFNVNEKGTGTLLANVPRDIGPIAMAAVTDETAGGVPAPKGSIQLQAKIQN